MMSKIYIDEFVGLQKDGAGHVMPVPQTPAIVQQDGITIGVGSAQSAAFNANTRLIRVHTDAICAIAIGADPTAVATKGRMAADQTEYFAVYPGQKLAVISST
jgi:hypothetical protein